MSGDVSATLFEVGLTGGELAGRGLHDLALANSPSRGLLEVDTCRRPPRPVRPRTRTGRRMRPAGHADRATLAGERRHDGRFDLRVVAEFRRRGHGQVDLLAGVDGAGVPAGRELDALAGSPNASACLPTSSRNSAAIADMNCMPALACHRPCRTAAGSPPVNVADPPAGIATCSGWLAVLERRRRPGTGPCRDHAHPP